MEKLPKFLLSGLAMQQNQSADHVDADQLSAFAEGCLTPAERSAVLSHLSVCLACRDVLALAARVPGNETIDKATR